MNTATATPLRHTKFVPAKAACTTFGPAAFTNEFVKATVAIAKDAPAVSYDGGAFHCGDVVLVSQRPQDKAIEAGTRNRWIRERLSEIGYIACSVGDVEEAQWGRSVRGMRVR